MKKRVYVETTVVSYLTAKPSRDIMVAGHQEATRELWPELSAKYDTYISALVFEEAKKGDADQAKMRLEAIEPFPMLDVDDEARSLAEKIIDETCDTCRVPGRRPSYCCRYRQRYRSCHHVEFCPHEQSVYPQDGETSC
ncbi:MAG: hypothetical protein Q8N70_00065 [Deltaproteobacteria bacterium]|nr:hypothetical protein [Deltaproteobacteria bacterium]